MVTIPITYLLRYGSDTFHGRLGVFIFLTVAAAIVIWRHRSNISRLLEGREHRIGTPTDRAA